MVDLEKITGCQRDFLTYIFLTPRDVKRREAGRLALGLKPELHTIDDYDNLIKQFVNQYGSRELTEEFIDYLIWALGLN
jgi:hypothetical protein